MNQFRTRMLVVAAVAVLFAAALIAPSRRAQACCPTGTHALVYPGCMNPLQRSGGLAAFALGAGGGAEQPIGPAGNFPACSLRIRTAYDGADVSVVPWDPLTLAPDPTTVALRSRTFQPSLLPSAIRLDFLPPIVTRYITGVAERGRTTTALEFQGYYGGNAVYNDSSGAADIPVALQYVSGGSRSPLPGPHPVLSHAVCGGDAFLQSLWVVQSVMKTDSLSDTGVYELIQRFSVRIPVRLRWAEVAFGPTGYGWRDPGAIAILDAQGLSTPPAGLPASMVEAPFAHCDSNTPSWDSHYDFDQSITLQADHDYWLLARVIHEYQLFQRNLTGGESEDFTGHIGPLFRRGQATGDWQPVSGKVLDFRLIGEQLSVLDAPGPAPPRSGLRLHLAPNPSRGVTLLSWSGASGTLRFDVIDARGRRVGGGVGGAGAEGSWMWRGAHDDGRALPAGLYFVRATDGVGRVAVERVVLVR